MQIFLLFLSLLLILLLILTVGKLFNAHKYKIRSKSGIQKEEYVTIGGIKQYIQLRGCNKSNDMILVLHGGPGSNMAYYSYRWQSELEKEYTIVHWDQRGCGNTYYADTSVEKPDLQQLLSDLDELISYLCSEYNRDRLILMGHSWGTYLGSVYSLQHPEKLLAFISVSQMIDFRKSENVSVQKAVCNANECGKTSDVKKISKEFDRLIET